jgi:hypothetical protein
MVLNTYYLLTYYLSFYIFECLAYLFVTDQKHILNTPIQTSLTVKFFKERRDIISNKCIFDPSSNLMRNYLFVKQININGS